MTAAPFDADIAGRLGNLLVELLRSPVARREFRYDPGGALDRRGFAAPTPRTQLVTRITGVSILLTPELLFGRQRQLGVPVAKPPEATDVVLWRAGARGLVLSHLPELEAEEAVVDALERGGHAALGALSLRPYADPARRGFADVAEAWMAKPGDGRHRPVLRSDDADLVVLGWLALVFGWDAYLGQLLGYPPCCSDAFASRWAGARRAHGGDLTRTLLPEDSTVLHATCNAFVRVMGADLPLHFPCAPDCVETDRQVLRQLAVLDWADPPRAAWLRDRLGAPFLLRPDGGVRHTRHGSEGRWIQPVWPEDEAADVESTSGKAHT